MEANTQHKKLTQLSPHLFWDTPIEHLYWWEHRAFIVERVMNYGFIEDWNTIKEWYKKEEMKNIVTDIRTLDDFSIAFLSLILDLPKEAFRCYNDRQSRPSFWHY